MFVALPVHTALRVRGLADLNGNPLADLPSVPVVVANDGIVPTVSSIAFADGAVAASIEVTFRFFMSL